MRTFAALTTTGVLGILMFKLLASLFLPILGLLFGLVAMVVKFALIAAVIFFVYSMLKKRRDATTA